MDELGKILTKAIGNIALKWCPECLDYDDDDFHGDCPVYKFSADEEKEVSKARSAIIAWVEGVLPEREEKAIHSCGFPHTDMCDGCWNTACNNLLQEIKARLHK